MLKVTSTFQLRKMDYGEIDLAKRTVRSLGSSCRRAFCG